MKGRTQSAQRNGRPAYEAAPPRLRQSDIDARRAWALHELHNLKGA